MAQYELHQFQDPAFPVIFHFDKITKEHSWSGGHWHEGVELLLGRYIVYSDNFALHVYDIETRALIFSSDPADGNMYIQWPQANSDSTMAVTYGNSRSDTDTNFIATIEITEN